MAFEGDCMRHRIVVRGPALSQSGYGEQTRFAIRSLREHEDKFDIFIVPVGWGQTGWLFDDSEERRWLDFIINKTNHYLQNNGTFDVSLQVTIPNEWEKLAPINVGFTAGIESDKITPEWIEKSALMDKIIVVSNHAKHGFDNTVYEKTDSHGNKEMFKNNVPVEAANYAVRNWKATELDIDFDYDFNFLAVAQWGPRKNMINTVKWFVEECYDREVGLVLKTSIRKNNVHDREETQDRIKNVLQEFGEERKCKVYALHGDMTEGELGALYEHPKIKCLVSLSHGEGFGLPIFEAVCKGVPVMCPEWGGQLDFLYAPVRAGKKRKNKAMFSRIPYTIGQIQEFARWEGVIPNDSNWCYPTQQGYKMCLRDMVKKYDKRLKNAKTLQKHVLKEFAHEKQYKKFADAVLDVIPSSEQSNVVKVFG